MDARWEITNLMARYAESLDGGRFDELGALFAEGEVSIEGGPSDGSRARGAAAVGDLYRSMIAVDASGRPGTRHFLTNFFIEVDPDGASARARSYFAVSQQTPTLPLQLIACGAYHDDYRPTPTGWSFASRRIVCDQVGELGDHMQ